MVASVSRLLFLVKYVLENEAEKKLWHVPWAFPVQEDLVSVLTGTQGVVPVSRISPAKGQRVRNDPRPGVGSEVAGQWLKRLDSSGVRYRIIQWLELLLRACELWDGGR